MSTSSKHDSADLLIVGAGVAGCAVALSRAANARFQRIVVLHFADERSGTESLSSDACQKLAGCHIKPGVAFRQVIAWWGSEQREILLCEGARIVQREGLAAQMRAKAAEQVQILPCKSRVFVTRNKGMWMIAFVSSDGTRSEIRANCICDATGRRSAIARSLGARRENFDDLCCVAVPISNCRDTGTWTESVSNGWWNLCSDGSKATLAFYSSPKLLQQALKNLRKVFDETREVRHLASFDGEGERCIRVCRSSLLNPCAGPGWFAVGDAAGTLQPLSSGGVMKALRDADFVGSVMETNGRQYNERYRIEFNDYLKQLAIHYNLEKRWLGSEFWKMSPSGSQHTVCRTSES